ncbi:hypothetical protein GCM10025876_25990 [Demequina litorisediminis]|uniref:N-acetyltransferase domain-containing protein n=1 Tax=Demequina litorisediminis TaxID=1849022 RepID=A0ABQ6IF06_9MICO|nr:hypothetical protein GCM10025876_25990 [Demequina litorisediminis]
MAETESVRIDVVGIDHAGELLTVRRAAFVTEAQAVRRPAHPRADADARGASSSTLNPMTWSPSALGKGTASSVPSGWAWRGTRPPSDASPSCLTSRVTASAPRLLFAVLGYLPETTREVWVFTGQNSKHNISMYNKAGYEHQFDQINGDLTYAYLRKVLESGAIVDDDADLPAVRGDN